MIYKRELFIFGGLEMTVTIVSQLAEIVHSIETRELIDSDALIKSQRLDRYVGNTVENVPLFADVVVLEQELGETRDDDDEGEAHEHAHGAEGKALYLVLGVVEREGNERLDVEERLAARQPQEYAHPVGAHRPVRVRVLEVHDGDELRE